MGLAGVHYNRTHTRGVWLLLLRRELVLVMIQKLFDQLAELTSFQHWPLGQAVRLSLFLGVYVLIPLTQQLCLLLELRPQLHACMPNHL